MMPVYHRLPSKRKINRMFQHTGRHIKRRPMCCPETEGVTPLLFELSTINGGVSTEKEI